MKRFISLILAAAVLAALTVGAANAAVPGGAEDPLISLSYISGYITNVMNRANSMIETSLSTVKSLATSQLDQMMPAAPAGDAAVGYKMLNLNSGGTVTITMGSSLNLISGTLRITSLKGTLINVSDGTVVDKSDIIKANTRYFAAENTTATFTVYSAAANVTVNGSYTMTPSGKLPASSFSDVSGHWAEEYIYSLSAGGIVSGMGDGLFMPNYTVTRGMFVTIMGRLYGVDKAAYSVSKFSDVSMTDWYGPYVAWAAEKGISTGYHDGTFAPNENMTREQMAVIIMRYAGVTGASLTTTAGEKTFADDSLIGSWAKDSVYAAQKAGLISGREDGSFDPKGTATRAEVCAIVYRLIKSINT